MPRRSGTITVWSFIRTSASGTHMSPVSPKPCSSTTAGPVPPTRTYWVPSLTGICSARNVAGQDFTSACAGVAASRLTADSNAATRRIQSGVVNGDDMALLLDGACSAVSGGKALRGEQPLHLGFRQRDHGGVRIRGPPPAPRRNGGHLRAAAGTKH